MHYQEEKELYYGNIQIPTENYRNLSEEKVLSIVVIESKENLRIKLRDPNEYSFNYSENIDVEAFEIMRLNQSLDIHFSEFKVQLVEMLQQFQRKEMYLKCKLAETKCSLIFYGKSRIKTIIYLTLDLSLTNQQEIIAELAISMQKTQESNAVLKKQLIYTKTMLSEKELEIQQIGKFKNLLEERLFKDLQNMSVVLTKIMSEFQAKVASKLLEINGRMSFINNKINILKQEHNLKYESTEKLLKSMENLKLDTSEQLQKINCLEQETRSLNMMKINFERSVLDLKKSLQEQEAACQELSRKNRELEKTIKGKEVVVLQKQKAIEELSKDLVQANGMLVNFNNHYDSKCNEVQELSEALANQEQGVKEVKREYADLQTKFEAYRGDWNKEKFDKVMHDLYMSNSKVQELEENIRKLNKINVLLTEKINRNMGFCK